MNQPPEDIGVDEVDLVVAIVNDQFEPYGFSISRNPSTLEEGLCDHGMFGKYVAMTDFGGPHYMRDFKIDWLKGLYWRSYIEFVKKELKL